MKTAANLTGQTLGPYDIHALIAEGGMAQVYRATHRFLNREVALKVLFPAMTTDSEFVERFRREGQHTAQLQHPHIVPVYDAGILEGQLYLAMAYIQGLTLAQRLQQGALPLGEAAAIVTQIAAALDYAHARGITHRDVKPNNILLDQAGRALLTDFGIARAVVDPALTQTGALIGTPAYMAPELIAGRPFDQRADVYALGLVLYEMATGRPPFHGGLETLLYQQVHQAPPSPQRLNPRLPAAAGRVILRALEKDPTRRFASAGAFAQAFQRAISAKVSPSKTTPRRNSDRALTVASSSSRLLWPIIGGGVLLILAVSLLLLSIVRNLRALSPMPTEVAPASIMSTQSPPVLPTSSVIRVGVIAGHSGSDSGAVCPDGLQAVQINIDIARRVTALLAQRGWEVDLLQEFDPRLNNYRADALIAIHTDSCGYPGRSGFKIVRPESSYIPASDDHLVDCLFTHYREHTGLEFDANTITYDMLRYHAFYEMDHNTPTAIIMTGFMLDDRQLLTQYPDTVALGIVEGLVCLIGEMSVEVATPMPTPLPTTEVPIVDIEMTPTPEPTPTSTPVAPSPTPGPYRYCILPSTNPSAPNVPAGNINPQTCLSTGASIPVGADIEVLPNTVSAVAQCEQPVIRVLYQQADYLIFTYRIGLRDTNSQCTLLDWQTHFRQPRQE